MATAMPLKSTARPACSIAYWVASVLSRPSAISSRQRMTMSSE